jgi:hypothetical protein
MNKEKTDDPKTEETIDIISPLQNTRQSRISSSMRFYLLKKKYQKKCGSFDNRVNNTLTHEEYT